jgi:DNA repair protein RecN (Recombination protein N)
LEDRELLYDLHLSNIAVVKEAEIELSSGFNVMTGQTGAGKSVIIGAIELLLGNKADPAIIRSGEDTASVSALFGALSDEHIALIESEGYAPDDDGMILISRTVSSSARPCVRINGRTATAANLKNLVPQLLNVHGQRDTQVLLNSAKHLSFLDRYADTSELYSEYSEKYSAYTEAKCALEKIHADAADADERRELIKLRLDEIISAKLKEGEEERLLEERTKLRSSELIAKQAGFAYRALKGGEKGNIISLLDKTQSAVSSLAAALPQTAELASRLEACRYELDDIAETIYDMQDMGEGDPTERLNRVESRLDKIEKIKNRYGPSVRDVLKKASELKAKIDLIENLDIEISKAEKRLDGCYQAVRDAGRELSRARRRGAETLDSAVAKLLSYLDMPKVRFKSVFEECEPSKSGTDSMQFCISANPGEPLTPLSKTASGGEVSRVMLALKCVLADSDGVSTMIFDEIDTGVSGGTARKIGLLLAELSRKIQIIAVTHSAQIASLADTHFSICKNERDGRNETDVSALDQNARVEEIARILGGINVTELQRDAARQLMCRDDGEMPFDNI